MDILERLEDSPLGAAVRRLSFCPRPEPEPPDEQRLQPTCPAASEDAGDSRIAPDDRPTDPKYDKTTDKNDQQQQHHEHDRQQQQQQPDSMTRPTARQQQIDRMTDRPTDRPRMNEQNDQDLLPPQQKQAEYEYDERQGDQASAAAAAAAASVGVGVGVGVGAQQAGDNSGQGTASLSVCRQQEQEQQMNDGRQYDRAIAAAVAAAMSVGMDAKQTGDCSEQGTATAYMLKCACPVSALQAVQLLEQYEETTAAATVATVEVSEGESAQNRGQRETDEWLYDEWLYSSDDEDDDVRYLDTLRALHRMDFSGISTGGDVGTKTWDCSRQQETPVQRGDILQDQDARIVQTKQRETADEAAQVATDDAAQAAADVTAAADMTAAGVTAADVTAAADVAAATDMTALAADAAAGGKQQHVQRGTVQERMVQQQFQQHREKMVFAGRFKCLASIRKEDEPPDWRSMQRGNAARAGTDFK